MAKVLTMIYDNPDAAAKILYANGLDGLTIPEVSNESASVTREEDKENENGNAIWEADNKEAEGIIDNAIQEMRPDYVSGSIKVLEGPSEGWGVPGVNDIREGIVGLTSELPIIGDIVKGIDFALPDIPSSAYKTYLVSADFNTINGIENDIFKIEFYEDGKRKMYWRGGVFE